MSGQRVEIPGVGECYEADKSTIVVMTPQDDAPPEVRGCVVMSVEGPALALPMTMTYDDPAALDRTISRLIAAREAAWGVKPDCQCPKCRARRAAESGEAGR